MLRTDLIKVKDTNFYGRCAFTGVVPAVCPITGDRDLYNYKIEYISNGITLELYSLKKYFISFKNVRTFQEDLNKEIEKDLENILETRVNVMLFDGSSGIQLRTSNEVL